MKRSLVLGLILGAAFAEGPANNEVKGPKPLLTRAIRQLRARKDVVARVGIRHDRKQGRRWGITGNPFHGSVEAWRDAAGVTVIVSDRELPGFGLYARREQRIAQTTFEGAPPSLTWVEAELVSLLAVDRFAKHVLEAHASRRLTSVVDARTGAVRFSGPISVDAVPLARVLRPRRFVSGGPPPRPILRAEATLEVSKRGKLESAVIKLVRDDQSAHLWQEAGSTTYTLSFPTDEPSSRAKAFKRRIQRMLASRSR